MREVGNASFESVSLCILLLNYEKRKVKSFNITMMKLHLKPHMNIVSKSLEKHPSLQIKNEKLRASMSPLFAALVQTREVLHKFLTGATIAEPRDRSNQTSFG